MLVLSTVQTGNCRNLTTLYGLLQVQLRNAELTGSIKFLQEELEAAKSANTQLQTSLVGQQQSWHEQAMALKADHDQQVCLACALKC